MLSESIVMCMITTVSIQQMTAQEQARTIQIWEGKPLSSLLGCWNKDEDYIHTMILTFNDSLIHACAVSYSSTVDAFIYSQCNIAGY